MIKQRKPVQSYGLVFGYLGVFLIIIGIMNLLPLLVIPFLPLLDGGQALNHASYWYAFVIPGGSSVVLGLILYFSILFKRERGRLTKHQDSLLVLIIWLTAILISGIPYAFHEEFTYSAGVFEAVSGLSTCGLTIFAYKSALYDPTQFCGYYLYMTHRMLLLVFGGVGLVLIVSTIISNKHGFKLYASEGHSDKLIPNLMKTARLILSLYAIYITLGTIALLICGMNFYDAMYHAVSSVATGGFSTHAESIAYYSMNPGYHPIAIEIITLVLMFLGSTNFMLLFRLFTGKIKDFFRDCEVILGGGFIILGVIIYATFIRSRVQFDGNTLTIWQCIRYATYSFISTMTTTGLSNIPANEASNFFSSLMVSPLLILMLLNSIVGNGIESTSGGIKQYRLVIAFKGIYWTLKQKLESKNRISPHQVYRLGKYRNISEQDVRDSYSFIMLYIAPILISCFVLGCIYSLSVDFVPILFEYATAIGCTGFSCGLIQYGNPAISQVSLWIFIIGMLLGRLELYPIYIGLYKAFSDIVSSIKKLFTRKNKKEAY